jgi:hypothetical protein
MLLEQTNMPKRGDYIFANADVSFQLIKQSVKSLDKTSIITSAASMKSQLEEAKQLGQEKLASRLSAEFSGILKLQSIIESGLDTYITCESVKAFVEKTPACYIDDLKDFRVIYKIDEELDFSVDSLEYKQAFQRKEASIKIKQALEMGVFDKIEIVNLNYPRHQEEEERRKEEERKLQIAKDPIAFGWCKEFPNHYFKIADWEDEYCNLTFDKMIESLKSF